MKNPRKRQARGTDYGSLLAATSGVPQAANMEVNIPAVQPPFKMKTGGTCRGGGKANRGTGYSRSG